MGYIKLKNKKGTAGKSSPLQYTSWLDFWEKNKGKWARNCEARACYENCDVGGHVIKVGEGNKEYILPLCYAHNNLADDVVFEAWETDLVPVH